MHFDWLSVTVRAAFSSGWATGKSMINLNWPSSEIIQTINVLIKILKYMTGMCMVYYSWFLLASLLEKGIELNLLRYIPFTLFLWLVKWIQSVYFYFYYLISLFDYSNESWVFGCCYSSNSTFYSFTYNLKLFICLSVIYVFVEQILRFNYTLISVKLSNLMLWFIWLG